MKKITLISLIVVIIISFSNNKTVAQGWAQPGAKWDYANFWAMNFGTGFHHFEYTGDTVIQGFVCSKIHGWHHWQTIFTPLTHEDMGEFYLRIDNDKIYRFINGNYYILYDFTAAVGDTVLFAWENFPLQPGVFNCDTMGYYIIDSLGTQNINGFNEPFQDISITDPYHLSPYTWQERVFKRFGGLKFLFTYRFGCDSFGIYEVPGYGPLCSYEDSTLGLFNYTGVCNISMSINEIGSSLNDLSVSPNPLSSEISINFENQNVKQTLVSIKNLLGQTVLTNILQPKTNNLTLDLSSLQKGIYFLEITIDKQRTVKKIVKQ